MSTHIYLVRIAKREGGLIKNALWFRAGEAPTCYLWCLIAELW
jgi:hypothetical protein